MVGGCVVVGGAGAGVGVGGLVASTGSFAGVAGPGFSP